MKPSKGHRSCADERSAGLIRQEACGSKTKASDTTLVNAQIQELLYIQVRRTVLILSFDTRVAVAASRFLADSACLFVFKGCKLGHWRHSFLSKLNF